MAVDAGGQAAEARPSSVISTPDQASSGASPIRVLSSISESVLDAALTSASSIELPGIVGFSWPATWGRRALVTVGFDTALLSLGKYTQVVQDATRVELQPVAVSQVARAGSASISFQVAGRDRDVALTIALPLRTVAAYPNEGVGPVSPVTVTIADRDALDANSAQLIFAPSQPQAIKAWALELYGIWDEVDATVGGSTRVQHYRHPRAIEIVSVGPAPSPADTQLKLSVDSRALHSLKSSGSLLEDRDLGTRPFSTSSRGDTIDVLVSIGRSLKVGESMTIEFDSQAHSVRPRLNAVRNATATIIATDAGGALRRANPGSTLVSPTSSGTPAVVREALGNI